MKIVSWNVNGIRAAINKGFFDWFYETDADVVCLQEVKISDNQLTEEMLNPKGYHAFFNCASRKGYSGTACFFKEKPLAVIKEFENELLNREGRIIQSEFNDFILFNIYFPNGQKDEARLQYKLDFYRDLLDYTMELKNAKNKAIILTGDFNTAHTEIDLKNAKANEKYSGFLPIEREWVSKYLNTGYCDIFRERRPGETGLYTWWSYRFNARKNNAGWRIDYFLITDELKTAVKDAGIYSEVMGSDHCPISLDLDL